MKRLNLNDPFASLDSHKNPNSSNKSQGRKTGNILSVMSRKHSKTIN